MTEKKNDGDCPVIKLARARGLNRGAPYGQLIGADAWITVATDPLFGALGFGGAKATTGMPGPEAVQSNTKG